MELIKTVSQGYVPVKPSECASVILELLNLYWDDRMDEETIKRQQALWYVTLKPYSFKTIKIAAMDWIKNSKTKPTPAHLLDACKGIDVIPTQMRNLHRLANLPIEQPQTEPEGKMLGCPLILSRLIGKAKHLNQEFTIDQQMDYLGTGTIPSWADTPSDPTNTNPLTAS